MMPPLVNKTKFIAILIMLFLTTVPVFTGIYFADPETNSRLFEGVRQRKADTNLGRRSRTIGEKIYLLRDKELLVNDCRLVFKGVLDKKIRFDAFLLDMDPEYAYRHIISIPDARTGFRVGTTRFSLVSASKNKLTLKTDGRY